MDYPIIPKPSKITEEPGIFLLNKGCCFCGGSNFVHNLVKSYIQKNIGTIDFLTNSRPISFLTCTSLVTEEYILRIAPDSITITSLDYAGSLYAASTLISLISAYKAELPCLTIKDKPKLAYRGYMLDVGRYFFSISDLKKQIEYLALFKINKFHLHLTEDHGWRVEIKKYPKLTEVGSIRKRTNFVFKPHSGYYTQDELKDLVAYAANYNIEIIPEIDMPGHIRSALASYSNLSCFDRKLDVAFKWGIKFDILCAGKDSTYQFVSDILKELADIFPSAYMHLGADEVLKDRWELCPHCQAKMSAEGLADTEALGRYFVNQVHRYNIENNKKTIVWAQRDDATLSSDIIMQYWQSETEYKQDIITAINKGRKIINGCSTPYYLDLPLSKNNLKDTYAYNPILQELSPEATANIIGGEMSLWSEFVPNQKIAELKTFPRLLAGAESFWSTSKDYTDFSRRVKVNYNLLDSYNILYTTLELANPSPMRKVYLNMRWALRQLCWEGLTNVLDNRYIKKTYSTHK